MKKGQNGTREVLETWLTTSFVLSHMLLPRQISRTKVLSDRFLHESWSYLYVAPIVIAFSATGAIAAYHYLLTFLPQNQRDLIEYAVSRAVAAVEQTIQGEQSGVKKADAEARALEILKHFGVKVPLEVIDTAIESTLHTLEIIDAQNNAHLAQLEMRLDNDAAHLLDRHSDNAASHLADAQSECKECADAQSRRNEVLEMMEMQAVTKPLKHWIHTSNEASAFLSISATPLRGYCYAVSRDARKSSIFEYKNQEV